MRAAFLSPPRDIVIGREPEKGSVAIVLRALARRLAQSEAVTIVSPGSRRLPAEETTQEGLHIRRIDGIHRTWHRGIDAAQGLTGIGAPHFSSRRYFHRYVRQAAQLLAKDPPDILTIVSYPQFAEILRPVLPETRFVLHLHDTAMLYLSRQVMLPRLVRFDAVVACSDWLCRALRQHYPEIVERIHAVPNGAEVLKFSPADAPRMETSALRLLFVGRVSPEKGVHVLIDAFARLAPRWPGLMLDIAGPRGLLPYSLFCLMADNEPMKMAAAFYGDGILSRFQREVIRGKTSYKSALLAPLPVELKPRVRFSGFVSHDLLAASYQSADLLVVPSICNEAFGLPIAEAMACGLPIVAASSGGIPDTVVDGVTGKLVPNGDSTALANAIEQLLADPLLRRRMGEAGRTRAAQLFSWDQSVARLRAIYAGLQTARGQRELPK
jgi:glycosyltransferase involved in cell wall biosynthesis